MPKMRSIRETARIFKEMDPDTQITETTLRKMISEGTIPVVKTGVKFLINVDVLLEMFGATPENGTVKIGAGAVNPVINK